MLPCTEGRDENIKTKLILHSLSSVDVLISVEIKLLTCNI